MSGVPYHAWTHRSKSQGGTDPIEVGGTELVHFGSWTYDTDPTVADRTWTPICAFTSGGGFFEETVVAPATQSSMTHDFENGIIGLEANALYYASGWVQYAEESQVDAEYRRVAITKTTGGVDRVVTSHAFDIADGLKAAEKLHGSSHWLKGFGTMQLTMQVHHNAGTDLTIIGAEFEVRRFEFTATADFIVNDPF